MSVFEEFGDPDRSTRAGWFARVAHALPTAMVIYFSYAALTWVGLIPVFEPGGWDTAYLAVLTVAAVFVFHAQLARLCIPCMESVPHDAPIRAARWGWLMWIYHRLWERTWTFLLLVVAFALVTIVLETFAGEAPWTNAPHDVVILGVYWSAWKHHRYRPWCPYCKDWGDGGSREPSPDPVGDGSKVA